MFHNFAGFVVGQSRFDTERNCVSGVTVLAFLDGILRIAVQAVGEKFQFQSAGEIVDG